MFKILLLNRKSTQDFEDQVTSSTQFTDKDNYVAYTAYGEAGETQRTIFFSIRQEKERFLQEANACIERLRRDEGLADDDDEDENNIV